MAIDGYGSAVTVRGGFDDVVKRVTEALAREEFGILTRIDVKQTLRQKIGVEFRRYEILGACNPKLAHQALQKEEHIGLLMPCNVLVQETDAGVKVSAQRARSMLTLTGNGALEKILDEADARIARALAAVSK
jgi:uncharacterized protein (DUF302 family)